jgi:3-oxoacyl-[acyl-carrier-protein] synthase II
MNNATTDGRTRVVITGMGAVSCLGVGVDAFWRGLLARTYGIRPITRFDTSEHKNKNAGEVRDFTVKPSPDPAVQFLVAAADEAVRQCGTLNANRVAVVLGTNFGAMDSGRRFFDGVGTGSSDIKADFVRYDFSQPAEEVAQRFGFRGIRCVVSLSCSSGNAALGRAAQFIRSGEADAALVGGFDSISEVSWAGLEALRTMTSSLIRPFDRRRDGTIFSEGAGVMILESLEAAERRGAAILAEFLGFWMNNNAYHMAHPDKGGESVAKAMRLALDDARLAPDAVDQINAHGTGTKFNDSTETLAIKTVFGERARRIPVNSIKSMIGHVMGAASSLEAICCVQTLREGIVPPTINLEERDPECDLDYVADGPRECKANVVLSNSSGIGGANCAAVFGKWPR